jgi:peptidoglycan/xylan/chitin deacetylase (PgdA/CDA1 family)
VRRRRIAGALLVAIALGALAVALGDAGGRGKGRTGARTYTGRAEEGRAADSSGSTRSRPAGGGGAAASGATAASGAEDVETPEIQHLIALGKPIYCAAPRGDEVALTFDDGPGQYTYLALPKLHKHHIKATFFIVGRNIPLGPRYLRQERTLGAVGDHTFTHPLLTALVPGEAEAQIVRTQQAVAQASGNRVFLFRPPYGARDATIDSIARAHGLLEIMWTVDSRDSLGADYAEIERNVIDGLRPGSIILMHENHGQTIRAMLGIFAAVQREHLRTVSVPRLLSDDPPSDSQVQAGGAGCGSLYRPGGSGG